MPQRERSEAPAPQRVRDASDVGGMIRLRRRELGYTQERLSSLIGMSPRLIGEIERGKKTTGIQKVIDLATALGIDLNLSIREKR